MTIRVARPSMLSHLMRLLTSTFGLFVINMTYLLLGAWLFLAIEAPREQSLKNNLEEERELLVDHILTLGMGPDEYYRGNASQKLALYERSLANFYRKRATFEMASSNDTISNLKLWTYEGAIIYCYSVITTIGWGNIVPNTINGKLGTVIYGLNGMPLFFSLSSQVGTICSKIIFVVWNSLRNTILPFFKKNAGQNKSGSKSMSRSSINNGGKETGCTRAFVTTSCSMTAPAPVNDGRSALLGANSAARPPDGTGFYGKLDWLKPAHGGSEDWSRLRRRRNSVYLKNARSCIDYMLYAHAQLARGRRPEELPHFRIKTKEDALLLCAQFSRMPADQLIKCMQYAGFDYVKEVLGRGEKTAIAHGKIFVGRTADTKAALSMQRASRDKLDSTLWPQEENRSSRTSCVVDMDVSFLNLCPIVEQHRETDASRGPTHTVNHRLAEHGAVSWCEHPTYSPSQATRCGDMRSVKCTGNSRLSKHKCSSYTRKIDISEHDFTQQAIKTDTLADAARRVHKFGRVQTREDAVPWPGTAREEQPCTRGRRVETMWEPLGIQSHKLRQTKPLECHENTRLSLQHRSENSPYPSCGMSALSNSAGASPRSSMKNVYTHTEGCGQTHHVYTHHADIQDGLAASDCTHARGLGHHQQHHHLGPPANEELVSCGRQHTPGHNMAVVTCPEIDKMAAVTCPEIDKMAAVTCPEIDKMEAVSSEKMSRESSPGTQVDLFVKVMPGPVTNKKTYPQHQQSATNDTARQCPHNRAARVHSLHTPAGPARQQPPVTRRRQTVLPQKSISALQDDRAQCGLSVVYDVNTDTRPRPQLSLDSHALSGSRPARRIITNTTRGKIMASPSQGYSNTLDRFVRPVTPGLAPQLAAQTDHISGASHQTRVTTSVPARSALVLTDGVNESDRFAGTSFSKHVDILAKSIKAEQETSSRIHPVASVGSATVGQAAPLSGGRHSLGLAASYTVSERMGHRIETHAGKQPAKHEDGGACRPAKHEAGGTYRPAFQKTGARYDTAAANNSSAVVSHTQTKSLALGWDLHPSMGRKSLQARHPRLAMIGRLVSAMVAASSKTGQLTRTGVRGQHTRQSPLLGVSQQTPGGLPAQSVAKQPLVGRGQSPNSQWHYRKYGDLNDNHDVETDEDDYDISTVYSYGRMKDPYGDEDDDDEDDDDDDDDKFVSRGFSFVSKDIADIEDGEVYKTDKKVVWEAGGDKKKTNGRKKEGAGRIKKAQDEAAQRAQQLSAELARMREEERQAQQAERFHVPLFVMYILVILYVLMGAVVFFVWDKDLIFWDSLYFIYVMLSTTGFGDLLPKPNMYAFIVVYGVVGMALYNIMINATLELFMEVLEYLASMGSSPKAKK
ncbi:hypothetical protein BsWGS_09835 [Bradybaena similaris]